VTLGEHVWRVSEKVLVEHVWRVSEKVLVEHVWRVSEKGTGGTCMEGV
jgi:hypothetical protein